MHCVECSEVPVCCYAGVGAVSGWGSSVGMVVGEVIDQHGRGGCKRWLLRRRCCRMYRLRYGGWACLDIYWKGGEEQELRAAQGCVVFLKGGGPVKRPHRPPAIARRRGTHASQAQAPALKASLSLRPQPRGRGVSTLLKAECSTVTLGWRGVDSGCRALKRIKAVLRGEINRETIGAEVDVAVGAVPPKGSCRDVFRATGSIAAVVGLMVAEEAHAASAFALWYIMMGRDGV